MTFVSSGQFQLNFALHLVSLEYVVSLVHFLRNIQFHQHKMNGDVDGID